MTNYLISVYLPAFKAAVENRTAFKDLMLTGKTPHGVPIPITPQSIPLGVVPVGSVPATAVLPNIKARLRLLVKSLKGSTSYTAAIGQDLKVIGPGVTPPSPMAQPKVSGIARPGFQVQVKWVKGKFTGVQVQSMRGAEVAWTSLEKDFRSPFLDTRPPLVANTPEVRNYRFIYLVDDTQIGIPSDTLTVTASS